MKKFTTEEFILKFKNIYKDKYLTDLINYTGYNNKVKVICKTHGIFEQTPKIILIYKKGCPYCNIKKSNVQNLKIRFNKIHNNKYDYTLFTEYKSEKTIINIICPEHGVFKQTINNHFRYGCKKCSGKYLDKEIFIEKSNKIHNNFYKYNFDFYINNRIKLDIECPIHGIFKQKPNDHLGGHGCPICKNSKGESIIYSYLKNNNINFETQKKFNDCKLYNNLFFDFYLSDYNICIEFDGVQHFRPIDRFGGKKEFELIEARDDIKNKYCLNNNIKLIRIKYDEDIIKKLNQIFEKNEF